MERPSPALSERLRAARERLQQELLTIWARTNATVIFVTHSIPEAVFLSDRVVVMSPRPGRIQSVVTVDLPRPRDIATRELPRFFELATEVREQLRGVAHHRGQSDPNGKAHRSEHASLSFKAANGAVAVVSRKAAR